MLVLRSWWAPGALLVGLLLGGLGGLRPLGAAAPELEIDPPAVAVGERLFLETRFAHFFFAYSGGNANAALAAGDPVMDTTETTRAPLPGPFAGAAMNCRACHLVDEQKDGRAGGNRTYADFARRSPVPAREDGRRTAPRNSPPLVNASLPREGFLLHFDGEFATPADLAKGTFTGRNFGWLPGERAQAVAHLAHIIRHDDGTGALAREFGGAYRVVLAGTDPAIPPLLRLPPAFRIDVTTASDERILDAVAALVTAYLESLVFTQNESGAFDASPYDVFLRKNGLPRQPSPGESDLDYSRRLRALVDAIERPLFVTEGDGVLSLIRQKFVFGRRELEGLLAFLREPAALPLSEAALRRGAVGNCIACHPAPRFTDFRFHNTGAAQKEYDALHGAGAFRALAVPDLATRRGDFDAYLPPNSEHPNAQGPFLDVPSAVRPGRTDLGLWNVFANPDLPGPQAALQATLCGAGPCDPAAVLPRTIAVFKTPGLRTLGMSAPYLHTGQADSLDDVLRLYLEFSDLARQGAMRNPSPALLGMAITQRDFAALAAFLRSLNEDYE